MSSPHQHHQHKLGLALFACLQNALVGGLVFGWASIDRTMLHASPEEGGADLTLYETTQLFASASCTAMMASLFLGPLLDAYGPRACLAVSHLLVVVGCGGFALSSQLWQFTLAVVLIAFGGPGIGLGIIHNVNLFPRNQFLAVSCLAGSITLSFTMLAILEVLWEDYRVSFRILFGGYSAIVALSMLATLVVSPDEPYELEIDEEDDSDEDGLLQGSFDSQEIVHPSLEQEYVEATIQTYAHHHQHHFLMTDQSLNSTLRRRDDDMEDDVDYENPDIGFRRQHSHTSSRRQYQKSHSFYESQEAIQSGNEAVVKLMSLKDQPFRVQLQSPTFARAVLIFVITSFSANFTIASLNTELEDLDHFTIVQQHNLSQQFTWLLSLGMLYAVLVGWLMDRVGLEVCTILTLLLGQLSTLLMMIASLDCVSETNAYTILLIGFALYSLFRQFLFPVFLAYITARLGFKYFGILSGIGFALSGAAQWFLADLVAVVHHGWNGAGSSWWVGFHIFQIVLLGVLMIIPIVDHRDVQRREVQMQDALRKLSVAPMDKRPTSNASTPATTATSATHLWNERQQLNGRDAEYGSSLANT